MEMPQLASEGINLDDTLSIILKNAVQALGGSAGMVVTWSEAEHRFIVSATYDLSTKAIAELLPFLDEAFPDLAGSKESFGLLSDLRRDLSLPFSDKGVRQNPVIVLPLQIGKKSTGLIYILRPFDAVSFSKLDKPVLTAFAEQAAIAIQNARLAYVLAQEKQRVESIIENSADGIMSINAHRRIVGFNSAMERLTGFSREEVLEKQCAGALNLCNWEGKSICIYDCPMLARSENTKSNFELQGEISTKDGHKVKVALVYSIVRSSEGQPLNAVINIHDISRLREIENLRSTFLAMIGHELQTPLSIIKGYTNTLTRSDGKWNEDTLRQGLEVIEEECDHLSKLMNGLILASRIEAGVIPLKKEPVLLSILADKVIRKLAGTTNIHTFEKYFDSDFPPVLADADHMEQVLSNLVDNAIKYSPEGGKIIVSGKVSDNHIETTVSDEGVGISTRDVGNLFQRFYRGNSNVTNKVRGMGLGLYLCKQIVEAHGGQIWLTSRLGKGSQFTFILPLTMEPLINKEL